MGGSATFNLLLTAPAAAACISFESFQLLVSGGDEGGISHTFGPVVTVVVGVCLPQVDQSEQVMDDMIEEIKAEEEEGEGEAVEEAGDDEVIEGENIDGDGIEVN